MNSLPRGMGRSFLARAKHGHMQCQFRAARSTLLSKGLQSQETKKLASTAQAHSSTIVPLLGNKLLFHSFATNQRASSLWPTASKHYNIYIYIYLYTRVLVSGPEMASWQPAVAGRRIPTPAASSPPLSPLVVTHLAQIGTIQANKSFV